MNDLLNYEVLALNYELKFRPRWSPHQQKENPTRKTTCQGDFVPI